MKLVTKRKNLNRVLRKNRNRARIFGTPKTPRLAIFRSNRFTYAQLIDDQKGQTLASASTKEFSQKAKGKASQAKLLGQMIAEKAKKLGIHTAIFNRSFYKFHGRVKAVADGAREGGLKI